MTDYPFPEKPSPELPERALERSYVSHRPVPLAELSCFPMNPHTRGWRTRLRESGELVLAVAAESWLFLWIVDVDKAEAHTRVAWPLGDSLSGNFEIIFASGDQTPSPLGDRGGETPSPSGDQGGETPSPLGDRGGETPSPSGDRGGETLWVIVHHNLIEISCDNWEVRSCRCFRDFAAEGAIIESSTLVSASPYLWVRTSLPSDTFLIDIESWTLHRRISHREALFTLVPGPNPLVCLTDSFDCSTLYRFDGTRLPGGDLPIDDIMYSLARAPRGNGLLTLEVDVDHEDLFEASDLTLRHFTTADTGSFQFISALTHRIADQEGGAIFVSRDQGLFYVLVHVLDGNRLLQQLLAVSVSEEDGGLEVHYLVSVPDDMALTQDHQDRRVVAVFTGAQGLNVLPLSDESPALDHLPEALFDRSYLTIPKIELDRRSCGKCLSLVQDRLSRQLAAEIRQLEPDQLGQFIDLAKAKFQGEVETFVCLYYALDAGGLNESSDFQQEREKQLADVHQLLREKYSEQPAAALLLADLEAQAEQWTEVRRWLRVAPPDHFQDSRRGHALHLGGLALARENRFDEAHELFSEGLSYEDNSTEESYEKALSHCQLGDLELLTRPMANPPTGDQWDAEQPLLRQLLGAIRTADGCRAGGDTESALAALDRPIFWQTGELQWAARQTELYLEMDDSDGVDLFQKRFALAYFREIYHFGLLRREEIHLPGITWERERINRIDEQARVWLETISS